MAIQEIGLQVRTPFAPQLRAEFDDAFRVDFQTLSDGSLDIIPTGEVVRIAPTVGSMQLQLESVLGEVLVAGTPTVGFNFAVEAVSEGISLRTGSLDRFLVTDTGVSLASGECKQKVVWR